MKKFYSLIIILISYAINAQILIADSNTNQAINPDAAIELRTNSAKTLLLPKVALTNLNVASPFPSHIEGMIVYNTANVNNDITAGFYYNDGKTWKKLDASQAKTTSSIGDIKYSAISNDHDGWYLLNGRSVTSLSSSAQTNAKNLGFSSNLPNSKNKFLIGKESKQTIGSVIGGDNIKLSQKNLPKEKFTGTTSENGNHTHTLTDQGIGSLRRVVLNNGLRNGSRPSTNKTENTNASGAHSHNISLNYKGENKSLDITPEYLSSYIFVYLGN